MSPSVYPKFMNKQITHPATCGHWHKGIGICWKQRNAGGRQPLWPQAKTPWGSGVSLEKKQARAVFTARDAG